MGLRHAVTRACPVGARLDGARVVAAHPVGLPVVERPSGRRRGCPAAQAFSTTRADTQHLLHDATRPLRAHSIATNRAAVLLSLIHI